MTAASGRSSSSGSCCVCYEVHEHVLEVVLVQGHALQQMVEQLRRHRRVDAGTVGHEHMDLVHALDVPGGEPLAGFSVQRIGLCLKKKKEKRMLSIMVLTLMVSIAQLVCRGLVLSREDSQ